MKLNKGGLILGGIYTGLFAFLQLARVSASVKASAVFAQFSVLPGMMLLIDVPHSLGFRPWIGIDSWLNNYYFFYAVSLVITYLSVG